MLTPTFDLSQTEDFLILVVKAPHAKVSETEIFIEDCDFRFHSKPYFLRLSLPAPLVEDGRESAKYDAENGGFTIRVPKANKGEHFEGLDMLTKLLAPKGTREIQQPIVELLSEETSNEPELSSIEVEEEEEFDWQIEQTPHIEEKLSLEGPVYGFANKKSGVFKRLQEELCDVIDLCAADETPACKRKELRMQQENYLFDDEHYMADFCDEDRIINGLINYATALDEEYKQLIKGKSASEILILDEEEKEIMRKLPRKEYLLDPITQQQVYLGLVDILFAYAYNHRTTEGENTVESSWTIPKLSGTLSWLQTFSSLKEVVTCSYRRSLCYPLYRHWKLSTAVLKDVYQILKLGRRKVLKCFLEIRNILAKSDMRYILNDLYITDYCVWIQSASKKNIESLAQNLKKVMVIKDDVGFDLPVLEQACVLAEQEASDAVQTQSELSSLHNNAKECKDGSKTKTCGVSNLEVGDKCEMERTSESSDSVYSDTEDSSSSEYTSESEPDTELESRDQSRVACKHNKSQNEQCNVIEEQIGMNSSSLDSNILDPKPPKVCQFGEKDKISPDLSQLDKIEKGVQALALDSNVDSAVKQSMGKREIAECKSDSQKSQDTCPVDITCRTNSSTTDSKSLNF